MRLVFLGTSDFAIPALLGLAADHDVVLVVTQPDRPAGRHAVPRAAPVKQQAQKLGLETFCPDRINDPASVERLKRAAADAFVVAAYGQLLRAAVFGMPPRGAINIHASLLPAYRGAAPVQWALIRGETETGVTTFLIDKGMDTGSMLLRRTLAVDSDETAGALEQRLAILGRQAILETLAGLQAGTVVPTPQTNDGASLAPRLTREDGRVSWQRPAVEVYNRIRGTTPWPGAWTMHSGDGIKIHAARRTFIGTGTRGPGTIVLPETGRLLVACQDELVELLSVQREGRSIMDGRAFLNGLRGDSAFAG